MTIPRKKLATNRRDLPRTPAGAPDRTFLARAMGCLRGGRPARPLHSRDYGGQGLGALSTAVAMHAFGHSCADMGLVFAAATTSSPARCPSSNSPANRCGATCCRRWPVAN
ncbi:hypothetical protein ACPA9J_27275 [Pseudomonas aeruginosa]